MREGKPVSSRFSIFLRIITESLYLINWSSTGSGARA